MAAAGILRVDNPNVYAEYVGAPVLHPQLAIVSYDDVSPFPNSLNNYGVYGLFIQRQFPERLSYGTKTIVANDSSIIAVAPGQTGGAEDNGTPLCINGWALLWSAELLRPDDPFFSYSAAEPLQMGHTEWVRISALLSALRNELRENADSDSLRHVAVGYLQLVLAYCRRIYRRQISPDNDFGDDILKRFHRLLTDYFAQGLQHERGLPTVAYCASELACSPHYFGHRIRAATGVTAIGYIHRFVIDEAKNLLMGGCSVSGAAVMLGFGYPHHLSSLFKRVTGQTATQFLGR